jgi:predicted nucleotidyltransferase
MWKMESPESDFDLFTAYQAPTQDILIGRNYNISKHTQSTKDGVLYDVQEHEINKIVHQIQKNNWNFVSGVLSPIVIMNTIGKELDALKDYTRLNLSKQIYHSIHGLAQHNFAKYIQTEKDYNEKRCTNIARTVKMGIKYLNDGVVEFDPVYHCSKEEIPKLIEVLDVAYKASPQPEKPLRPDLLDDWLLDMRIQDEFIQKLISNDGTL